MEADEVLHVLEVLEEAGVSAGITGGWGIDALLGYESRRHRDLDLGISAADVERAVKALSRLSYRIALDQRPARLELQSQGRRRVDLHPIVWDAAGNGVQVGFGDQRFLYPAGSLYARGRIGGRAVRCGTPELQVRFHLGYRPTRRDREDMAALARHLGTRLPAPYSS